MTTARLYLVTPAVAEPAGFAPQLEAALPAADVAAVLLRLADADERTLINRIKALAPVVQRHDVALVLDGHADLVVRSGADGAQLFGIDAFAAALALLKPERIAGAGGLRSRHDAMLAGENGADYVMFGDPPAPSPRPRPGERKGGARAPAFAETLEHVAWWAELVEVPCVGYAADLDEARALAGAGAEFVALGEWIWTEATADTLAAATQILAAAAPR